MTQVVDLRVQESPNEIIAHHNQQAAELTTSLRAKGVPIDRIVRGDGPDQPKDRCRGTGREGAGANIAKGRPGQPGQQVEQEKAESPKTPFHLNAEYRQRICVHEQMQQTNVDKARGEQSPVFTLHDERLELGPKPHKHSHILRTARQGHGQPDQDIDGQEHICPQRCMERHRQCGNRCGLGLLLWHLLNTGNGWLLNHATPRPEAHGGPAAFPPR